MTMIFSFFFDMYFFLISLPCPSEPPLSHEEGQYEADACET
jgi:hypothetical protein